MPRSLVLTAAISFALAGAAVAQTAPAPVFSADHFRSHVAFLSNDLLEGRDTGSRGHEIAAAYVASQFEGLGLKPGGENGSWYQEVPFRSSRLGEKAPTVTISGPGGSKIWENATDVLVGPSAFEAEQDVSAPVVFAGYGIDAPGQGLDDYKGLDVRGKIVAVLAGTPDGLPSEISAHFGDVKEVMAAKHGAIGLITLPTEDSEKRRPWAAMVRRTDRPRLTWLDKNGKPLDEAPGLKIGALLNGAAAEALFAGAPKNYAEIRAEAAKKGFKPKGFPLKSNVRITRSSTWSEIKSPEVIGMLPGSDPALKDEYVLLTAHLDHLGIRKSAKPGEDRVYNGALDNAAGIATMLEVARSFAESGEQPRRSILFVANTAEEKGLLGADYFAHHPTVPIDNIAAVVDLDMPLLLYKFTDVIAFGADHSTVAQTVRKAAAEMGVALSPDPMPEENIFVRSDHYMFVRQGVPAILLATGFANGGEAHWREFLSNEYHSVKDDMSQKIDWESGARFAKLNYLISRDLADADTRPMWHQNDFFGDLYAPGQPRAEKPAGK